MKGWPQGWLIAGGFALLLLPQAAFAQARDLAEARAAIVGSGEQSIRALNRALALVADLETRAAIERARNEVRDAQRRALQNLDRAERGLIPGERPGEQGLTIAISATAKHLEVLAELLAGVKGKVPDDVKATIQAAMTASKRGNEKVSNLLMEEQAQKPPRPVFSPPPGQEDRPSPPAGPRPFDGRGGSGPPGGSRPGR